MLFKHEIVRKFYQQITRSKPYIPPQKPNSLDLLVLNISENCNLQCKYCFASQGSYGLGQRYMMSPADATVFLGSIIKKYRHINTIKFFGGEPLLNIDCIAEVCLYTRKMYEQRQLLQQPHYHINTNLTLLNDRFIALIKEFGITVTVGIDGPPEIHNVLRPYPNDKKSFSDTDTNVRKLVDMCRQPRSLETVYTKDHLKQGFTPIMLHEYLAERYGERHIFIHPQVSIFKADKAMDHQKDFTLENIDKTTIRELFTEYGYHLVSKEIAKKKNIQVEPFLSSILSSIQQNYCTCGLDQLTIAANGDVYPCYGFFGKNDFVMSNACSVENLEGEIFKKLHKKLKNNVKKNNQQCENCDLLKTCRSCPAEMLQLHGSVSEPVPVICAFRIGLTEGKLLALSEHIEACKSHSVPGYDQA